MRRARSLATRAGTVRALLLLATIAGVLALAGCGNTPIAADGLSSKDRKAAQAALDKLQNSNISTQLLNLTLQAQNVPAACQIREVPEKPGTYEVYVFWIPWLAVEPYAWITMHLTGDPHTSTFHLETTEPILPGGRLNKDGQTINRGSVDTTLLSRYGAEQAKKSQLLLRKHGGNVFAKPSAPCQLLKNGSLRLLPSA